METPRDFALFRVMQDCFRQKVTKYVGYEAQLAHVSFSLDTVEEMAVSLTVTGFSDKILVFAETYIQLLLWCAEPRGFDRASVLQAIEKVK